MYGNQRNFLTTYFNIGIIIGTVPAQMIQLKWIRPSVLIPSCELAWSFLVMAEAGAKNYQTARILYSIQPIQKLTYSSFTFYAFSLDFSKLVHSQDIQPYSVVGMPKVSLGKESLYSNKQVLCLACLPDTYKQLCTRA